MQNIFTIKRIIIGLVGLVVLFLVVGAIWYYFLRGEGADTNSDGGGFLSGLFPDSGDKNPSTGEVPTPQGQNQESIPDELNIGRGDSFQIVDVPVAGATFYKDPSTSSGQGKIRYIDKASGNFVEVDTDGKGKTPLSSNKISGVYDAVFSSQGTKAIIRSFSADRATTIVSSLVSSSSVQTTILPIGTKDATFSPKGDRIAYVLHSGDSASVITATTENKSQIKRLTMKYSDWKLLWVSEASIFLQSKPSAFLGGFLYKLTLSGNSLTKIFGPLAGLEANASASNIIFSASNQESKSLDLYLSNISGGDIGLFLIKTIPEKCIWSKKVKEVIFCATPIPLPSVTYPDDWYKGKVSFTDIIIKINISSRAINSFLLPETLDSTKLFLSDDESTLFFVNKVDESLWRLKIQD